MLSDNQLEHIGDQFAEIFQELEQDVINDIARRLKKSKRWTETAELQAEALRELGFSPYEIQMQVLDKIKADPAFIEEVTANTLEYKRTVRDLINKAVAEGKARGDDLLGSAADMCYRDDLRLWQTAGKYLDNMTDLGQVIAFYQRQLQQSINNLTRTTGFAIRGDGITPAGSAYQHELNKVLIKSTSGSFTPEQAIQDAISKLAESGLRYVSYSSGVARNLDTAMRLAIRTTSAQMAGEISMNNLKDTGEDLVEVSYHAGARNEGYGHMNHAQWQGKVYSISGRPHPEESLRLGYRIEKLEDATGYPSDPLGLCGYNCRHTFYPFFEGISEPNAKEKEPEPITWHGKEYDRYHAMQKQRQMEREIRATKRKLSCGVNGQMALLTNRELQYKVFCEHVGLTMNMGRLNVANARSSLWLLDQNRVGKTIEKTYGVEYNLNKEKLLLMVSNDKDEKILYKIRTEYNLVIHEGRQGKHILKHNNYKGKSYLLDGVDPQELVNQYAGTGGIRRDKHGRWIRKQFYMHDTPIGMVKDENGVFIETKMFSISYSKQGTHVVPRLEK